MEMARLPRRGHYRDIVDTFRGYNHNLRPADGEAFDMENMCSDHAPLASVRGRRGIVGTYPGCGGIIMKEKLWRVDGTTLTNGTDTVELGLEPGQKRLVSMGAYIIVLPDKVYLNTAELADCGAIDTVFTTTDFVTIRLCKADGDEYPTEYISPEEPENPENGAVWVDTSQYPNVLRQYSGVSGAWTPITVSTVKLTSPNIGKYFQAGDGVVISGITEATGITDANTQAEVTQEQREQLNALDGAKVIVWRDNYNIVVDGIMDAACTIPTMITIKRQMPAMDFIVEHKNRLWGCRYGPDSNGEFANILYASKLGDFKNWQCYQGVDTDSYFVNVGSDGSWTGAISYGDMMVFAKENVLHLVYGDGPSSFQVQQIAAPGVQNGSDRSMAIVGGVLYYKGVRGVLAFDGSLPTDIGYCLGGVFYSNAVGGSYGAKYLISMIDRNKKPHFFAWDTERRLWHREDGLRVEGFASGGGETWMLCENGRLLTVGSTEGTPETPVKWFWQSGVIGAESPDRKRLQRVNVRVSMAVGARMSVLVRYDSRGGWNLVGMMSSQSLRAIDWPVKVHRCDHLELRFEGVGNAKIHSFTKRYTTGSDRR